MTFGERVNHMRVALGWSLEALAAKANLTATRVQALERGAVPNTRQRLGLARALGVTPEYLDTGEGETGLQARPAYRAVMAQLERLPPPKQDELLVIFGTAIRAALANKEVTL